MGQAIEIDDPSWTRPRSPEAVLRHEEIHQQLSIGTHHGVVTLILAALARHLGELKSFDACLAEQAWVQELCATYGELALVQRLLPAQFDAAIDSLPTGNDGGIPYRALFDAANGVLPLDDAARVEDRDPRALMMGVVASAAMNTDGLSVLAGSPFDDDAFAAWVEKHSPEKRFSQLVNAMTPESILALTKQFGERLAAIPLTDEHLGRLMKEYIDRLAVVPGGVAVVPTADLPQRAQAAVDALRSQYPGFDIDLEDALAWKEPEFVDSEHRRRALEAMDLEDRVGLAEVSRWLQACSAVGGLHIMSPQPDPDETSWFALVCVPSVETGIPDDLRVRLSLEQLFQAMLPFDHFPDVVTYIGDASIYWQMALDRLSPDHWIRERIARAIQLHVHRRMSGDLTARLVNKAGLAATDGARAFVTSIGPEAFVAIIDNPAIPGVYAIQKLPSMPAVDLFWETVGRLQIVPNETPDAVPHLDLLLWIIQREFRDLTEATA